MAEYAMLRGDTSIMASFTIIKELETIRFRARLIFFLVECLEKQYYREIAEQLKTEYERYSLQFTEDSYMQDIEDVIKIEKNNITRIEQLEKQLQETKESQQEGRKLTRTDYIQYMLDINQHEGSVFTEDTMTLELFAICIKRLADHCRQIKEQQAKIKR